MLRSLLAAFNVRPEEQIQVILMLTIGFFMGTFIATFSVTADDVCDGARPVTCTPASGSSFPIGVTTVNCTASDTSGNSRRCQSSLIF